MTMTDCSGNVLVENPCAVSAGLPVGTDSGLAASCNMQFFDKLMNGTEPFYYNRVGKKIQSVAAFKQDPQKWFQRDFGVTPLTNAADIFTTDHSDQFENALLTGGAIYFESGVYVIKRNLVGRGITTVIGESAGAGTGGFDPDEEIDTELEGLIKEAAEGATIFYVANAAEGFVAEPGETHALSFRETRFRNMPSVYFSNFKIATSLSNPAPCGLMQISGAYDNNAMNNVNLYSAADDKTVLEVTKNVFENSLGQSVNWVGVNAIGALGGNRTAPTIRIDWLQEGTFDSCKAFGSPYRVDGGGNPLYSANDCWEINNSRGLVWTGCSGALTLGSGFVFRATERQCINHTMMGCTYELIGSNGDASAAAIKVIAETSNGVGNINILSPRTEAPVYQFLRTVSTQIGTTENYYSPFGMRGDLVSGDAYLDIGVTGCVLQALTLDKVTDNSGNNSNSYWSPANSVTGYDIRAKSQAIKRDVPEYRFETSLADMNDFYSFKWNATALVDFGFEMTNERAGKHVIHNPDGSFDINNGVDFASTTARIKLHPDNGIRIEKETNPVFRFVAGNTIDGLLIYKVTHTASVAGGAVNTRFEFDGTPQALIHHANGDFEIDSDGEAGFILPDSNGNAKKLTITPDGKILINGSPLTL